MVSKVKKELSDNLWEPLFNDSYVFGQHAINSLKSDEEHKKAEKLLKHEQGKVRE